eukprot:TRINITY_DN5574_c0_g1_i1.p1 TRINITY_DN5574_c0_g1~~TRINITY_DN5574_c0_g1_i1.p1  ORF type:complete len:163 (-),score=42.32 TRINITY_DN5574_c0_g1_i1:67-555(-)
MAAAPTTECVKRLQLEWQEIVRHPVDNILTRPDPDNICCWHYVLLGPEDTSYEGGVYYGTVVFKSDYPLSPPSIFMKTPSGRFKTDTRLCLSMSDFHPETWVPSWSVSSILLGLLSFMLETAVTYGSIETSATDKIRLAQESLDFNRKVPKFVELFPELRDD